MLFNTQAFVLGFAPTVLLAYYALAASRPARLALLCAASLTFYALWDWRFVPLLVGLTLATWLTAQAYSASGRRAWLGVGIALNLATLAVCKYANFLGANLAALVGLPWRDLPIILPLGISFFVFQKLSYLIDLHRGAMQSHDHPGGRPIYGFLEFCAFVTFFPALIAGPLVRHNEIIPQFRADPRRPDPRGVTLAERLSRGLVLFIIGMAKKSALADTLAGNADPLFARAATHALTAAEAWLAAWTYTLQIFFDFSGYSDMAIGIALMFGLSLPFNFDSPYRATSIRDFWRRWHITLSRFLRDYLYIPLGGNRDGAWHQARNVVATMLLGGLWHGASWTFVAWGGAHGAALALNGAYARSRVNEMGNRIGRRLPAPLGWALTLLFVVGGWVLFRAADFGIAASMLASMATLHGIGHVRIDNAAVVIAASAIALLGPSSQTVALNKLRPSLWLAVPAGAGLVFLLLLVGGRVPNEFIYFQF